MSRACVRASGKPTPSPASGASCRRERIAWRLSGAAAASGVLLQPKASACRNACSSSPAPPSVTAIVSKPRDSADTCTATGGGADALRAQLACTAFLSSSPTANCTDHGTHASVASPRTATCGNSATSALNCSSTASVTSSSNGATRASGSTIESTSSSPPPWPPPCAGRAWLTRHCCASIMRDATSVAQSCGDIATEGYMRRGAQVSRLLHAPAPPPPVLQRRRLL